MCADEGAGRDGSFLEAAENRMCGAELSLPAPIEQLFKHQVVMLVQEGVGMNVGVGILFLESRQRVGPEDEEPAGEGAGDSFNKRAGVRFAATEGCHVSKRDVAVRSEVEILAEANASLFFFRPGD